MKKNEKKHTDVSNTQPARAPETAPAAEAAPAALQSEPCAAPESDAEEEVPAPVPGAEAGNTGNATPPEAEKDNENVAPDVEVLIAEAEQRGYLRGRNESIEELMRRPTMMQTIAPAPPSATETAEEPAILRHRRISIWDR